MAITNIITNGQFIGYGVYMEVDTQRLTILIIIGVFLPPNNVFGKKVIH